MMYDTNGCHGLEQIRVVSRMDGWMDSDHFGGSDVSAVVVLYVLALLRHPVHQLVGGVLDAAAV